MTDRRMSELVVPGLLIGLGMALAGYFVGNGFLEARAADRYVTVKGLAEREVPSDLAIWPVVYTVTADDLGTLQARLDEDESTIRSWLEERFGEQPIDSSAPRITDRQAQGMMNQGGRLERYVAEATVTVRTGDIAGVRSAMASSGELVRRGVALIRSYEYQTQYLYTDLESIKPEMIAEATRDARRAAQQFAEDSGSRVGAIRTAQQGYFSIQDRDQFSPEFKRIRVVTTVQYFLIDD
jgi:hypothetical protein